MFVYVVLLCITLFVLVSANPLLQALAQQTCPVHNCQQDHRNVQVNRQQPRNTSPYIQPTTVQNTQYPCQQSPQNEFEQLVFNKILSNPTLRTLLDPNTKLLNHNGFEVPRQIPNNAGCAVPNVINNYIIVPPELLLNEPVREEFRDDRRNNNRRRDDTNPRRNAGEKRRKTNVNPRSDEKQRPLSQNARESRKGRLRQDEYKRDGCERDISDDDFLEHDREKHDSRRVQDDKRNVEAQSLNKERQRDGNKDTADHADTELNVRRKTQESYSSNKEKNSMTNKEKATGKLLSNDDIEQRVQDRTSNSHLVPKAQMKPPTRVQNKLAPTITENSDISRKEITNNKQLDLRPQVNSYPRNLREEAVIQDFRRKFPAIPENVVRSLLSHLKLQLKNDQLGNNPYCLSCPINYDQLHKTYSPNIGTIGRHNEGNRNKNGRRKSGRRRNRKRKQQKKENDCGCDTTVELAPSIYVEEPVTTEPTTMKREPIRTELEPTNAKRKPIKTELESTTTKIESIKTEPESTTIKAELQSTTTKRVPIKTELEPSTTKRIIERTTITSTTVPAATESTTVKTEQGFAYTTTAKEVAETTTKSTIAEESNYPKHQDDLYDKTAVPELGTEDVVPTIYMNGVVDDYYPDFTADNNAYAYSNENLYVQNLQEERYHYTTDKNVKMKELNGERRKYIIEIKNVNQLKDRHIQSENGKTDIKSFSDEIEATIPKPIADISEEINFRPPPFLEEPDFETKQINKGTLDSEEPYYYHKYEPTEKYIDVTDKASTYSNVKTPKYVIKEKFEKKKPNANIETVYAKSKVVKFGQPTERSDEIISNETRKDLSVEYINSKENKLSVDGETTFVIAKSYPDTW